MQSAFVPSKRVVLTRPQVLSQDQTELKAPDRLVQSLALHGYRIEHVPLMEIAPSPESPGIEECAQQLHQFHAIMFVSPQAVKHFFARLKWEMSSWTTPCWVTGGGSHAALVNLGVKPSLIVMPDDDSGLWDSEHLWLRVEKSVQAGQKVLIVRGRDVGPSSTPMQASVPVIEGDAPAVHLKEDASQDGTGREYLSQKLQAKGLEVRYWVAYQRRAPSWSVQQSLRARALLTPSCVWLFTSSQAAKNLAELLKPVDFSQSVAIATHERIVKELRHLGFGVVLLSLPGAKELMRSLESLS